MHELSLVHALFDEVDVHVSAHPGGRLRQVRVRLGDAAGVDPELFRTAFDAVAPERGHSAATLAVEREAEAWACAACGATLPPTGPRRCGCGGPGRLVRGDALVLDHLELEVP